MEKVENKEEIKNNETENIFLAEDDEFEEFEISKKKRKKKIFIFFITHYFF